MWHWNPIRKKQTCHPFISIQQYCWAPVSYVTPSPSLIPVPNINYSNVKKNLSPKFSLKFILLTLHLWPLVFDTTAKGKCVLTICPIYVSYKLYIPLSDYSSASFSPGKTDWIYPVFPHKYSCPIPTTSWWISFALLPGQRHTSYNVVTSTTHNSQKHSAMSQHFSAHAICLIYHLICIITLRELLTWTVRTFYSSTSFNVL